ncbi:hypothetical protein QOZ80_1AG0035060 [Eleusine coracana subsp. coracana]|nr:hypothetical protein QOZ80_1AG0035060 [Eleusine coracana subsp. coracana]
MNQTSRRNTAEPAAMAGEARHLDTARSDRSVWLMKCPPVVSRAWQEAASASASATGASASDAGGANPNPNPVVAKVVLSLDPLQDDQPHQIKMEMVQAGSDNAPKSYSLNMHNDIVPMCIFSESNQGKLVCEGKVGNKFDMKPHRENLADYGKLCRERTNMSMVKPRKVEFLPDDTGIRMRPLPGPPVLFGTKAHDKKKTAPVKPSDMKRTRRDPAELQNILFKLFERQPNWSLKQLMHETDQPEQFLKEMLNNLCVYNKRGPNQGTHELKPEYKKFTEDDDAT